jgi:hypothetical protein
MRVLAALPVVALAAVLGPGLIGARAPAVADTIPYPTDFRRWTHVKSEGSVPPSPGTSAGIHHVYANAKALDGYLTGRFPEGAMIVADFMETRDSSGAIVEASRLRIDVMMKDSKRFGATGGWGYERFRGDSETDRLGTPEVVARCYDCHTRVKGNDFVFTRLRR